MIINNGSFETIKEATIFGNDQSIGRYYWRRLRFMPIIRLTMALVFPFIYSTAFADMITLPAGLQVIETEAFYGDASLDTVILLDGIKTIKDRAFANSSIKKIQSPESLLFMASTAFIGCSNLNAEVYEGSYAHLFCDQHGIEYTLIRNKTFDIIIQPADVSVERDQDAIFSIEGELVEEFAWQRSNDQGASWKSFSFGETNGQINTLTWYVSSAQ